MNFAKKKKNEEKNLGKEVLLKPEKDVTKLN